MVTRKQFELLRFIHELLKESGVPPSFEEMKEAMPVILTAPDQFEAWMTRSIAEAIQLQRPLSDGILSIVARGSEKQDQLAL